jgi:hypothetical protein
MARKKNYANIPIAPAAFLAKKTRTQPRRKASDVNDYFLNLSHRMTSRTSPQERFHPVQQPESVQEEYFDINQVDINQQVLIMKQFAQENKQASPALTINQRDTFQEFALAVQAHYSAHQQCQPQIVKEEVVLDLNDPTVLRKRIATLLSQIEAKDKRIEELKQKKADVIELHDHKALCGVCLENDKKELIYPCGHVVCIDCSKREKCPYCARHIDNRVVVFL